MNKHLTKFYFYLTLIVFVSFISSCSSSQQIKEEGHYQEIQRKKYQKYDQASLRYLYENTGDINAQCAMLCNITDQPFLAEIFNSNYLGFEEKNNSNALHINSCRRFGSIVGLKPESIIKYKLYYNNFEYPNYFPYDPATFIMHLKIATLDTLIIKRIGKIEVLVELEIRSEKYSEEGFERYPFYASGQAIKIKLVNNNNVLLEGSWVSDFPFEVKSKSPFFPAKIHNKDTFLSEILNSKYFTKEELNILKQSELPEIKNAVR